MLFEMDVFEEDLDMSYLTQVPKLEDNCANFNVGYSFIEEDLVGENVVSLEENSNEKDGVILYDNVRVQDISLDEELDSM